MSAFAAVDEEIEDLKRRVAELEAIVNDRVSQPGALPRTKLRVREVAAMMNVCTQTVRNMIADGRLEAEDVGGWYAIEPAAVDALSGSRRAVAS